jgi:hypothetical protein
MSNNTLTPSGIADEPEHHGEACSAVGLLDPNFYVDIDQMHEAFREWRRTGAIHRDAASGLIE